FLLGVRHALEADHLSAVASLAARSRSLGGAARIAAVWGMGHWAVLVVLGSILVGLGATLPDRLAKVFELAAGGMLVLLGVRVLRRLRSKRFHLHEHRHCPELRHIHFHSHEADPDHHSARHRHRHATPLIPKAFLVGSMHGLAGSAALIVIALPVMHSIARAIVFMAVFGLGSIFGMVLFSTAISLPLQLSARRLTWAARGLEGALGITNIALGCYVAARAGLL